LLRYVFFFEVYEETKSSDTTTAYTALAQRRSVIKSVVSCQH